jgi:hypothetical protein
MPNVGRDHEKHRRQGGKEMYFRKMLLPLNLQMFAADTGGDGGQGDGGQGQEDKKAETKTEDKQEHMIPKSRFDEVNDGYKTMKKEFDAMKAAQTKAEQDRIAKEQEDAEKKGEFEGLYNKTKTDVETFKGESKAAKERIGALEGVIQGLLDAKLKTIDENYHDLIPEGISPEQKLAWVSNAESKGLFGNKAANTPLGDQTNPKTNQEVDTNKLNPLQMLMSGYSKK